ncbi:transcription factor TGA2.2-like isoform X1 [Zingiber officinale]|uniref:transcription factor TGA2.2-like isoform X1 n=1 Tax=Zingiber officinale TaxID=94328 RepID=UPI001C4DAFFE|nr:transcription factor TGA2.2-like isoform X1 [Zingiber officinale]XP_042385450.1 transcription factor TGA2.2-like isoform X1 [Zingiber officinale]XP_042385451.1 transcription factor TGA2.2-like isoform X1 [Zingiber officinale]
MANNQGEGDHSATNFFDQEGAAYFGELEEALVHGVAGIASDQHKKSFCPSRPPTLHIFPSRPIRFQQFSKWDSQTEGSTDSGSEQNTLSQMDSEESPVSRKASSALFGKQKEKMASDAPHTTGEENQQLKAQEKRRLVASTSDKDGKSIDPKTLRRLAQNREAAKKSRLRKKAYIQQLESSKIKLTQLEQDLQRARAQGLFLEGCGANENVNSVVFDMEYSRWLAEDCKNTVELRRGLETHLPDAGLRVAVDRCLTHYDELFQLKATTAKSDVFHIITGVWTTPAERCFLWMGGFRPSELLRVVIPQLDPLTEQQLVGIYNLQQSSQQAEEALSQGLEQFQLSLANTVASDSLIESANLENYMGHMAMAVGKLANLEGFVRQADNLRQQSLHQMHRILTTRQAARCFLAIGEYHSRLRALSSLWASRPRENLMNESALPVTTELQTVQQPVDGHFSGF